MLPKVTDLTEEKRIKLININANIKINSEIKLFIKSVKI